MVFVKMNNLRSIEKTQAAKDKLTDYMKVIEARQSLFQSVAVARDLRAMQVTDKIARLWVKKINLHRFWTWRGLVPPIKREVSRRLGRIMKLQAFIRGMQLRASPVGRKVKLMVKYVREVALENHSTIVIQRHMMAYTVVKRFHEAWEAASIIQFYFSVNRQRKHYEHLKACATRIQSAYRKWVVAQLLTWEKLKVLKKAEDAFTSKMTAQLRQRAFSVLGVRPLSVVDSVAHADLTPSYPDGWFYSLVTLLKRDSMLKLVMGAEHTILLGVCGLYGWGSNEVGQLGIGDLGYKEQFYKEKKAAGEHVFPVHSLIAPVIKNKVLDVSCGRWHTIAQVEGPIPIVCWGLNHRGQCGVKTLKSTEPFTPTYPKIVRTPAYVQIDEHSRVHAITAGPFASAVLLYATGSSDIPSLFIWGEGTACGQEKDVRLPLFMSTDHLRYPCQAVLLGDGFGMIKHAKGVASWGMHCAHLGQGLGPDPPYRTVSGFVPVDPSLRFDSHPELGLRCLTSASRK